MALYGAFSRHEHLNELKDPLDTQEGVLAPATRQLRVLQNIAGQTDIVLADLQKLADLTATAAEINLAADESANTEIVTTTNVLTAAESGKTLILNSATAFVTTLPAKAAGLRFKFYVGGTIVSGGNHTIIPNAADDNTIFGQAVVAGVVVLATVEGSVNLIADLTLPGDWIEFFNDGTNWYVSGQIQTAAGLTFTT